MGWFGKSDAEKREERREEERQENQRQREEYQKFLTCQHAWRKDGLPHFDVGIKDTVQDYYCPLCGGRK